MAVTPAIELQPESAQMYSSRLPRRNDGSALMSLIASVAAPAVYFPSGVPVMGNIKPSLTTASSPVVRRFDREPEDYLESTLA